jgi:hypothetical protein
MIRHGVTGVYTKSVLKEPNCAEAKVEQVVNTMTAEILPICFNNLYKSISVYAVLKLWLGCDVEGSAICYELRVVRNKGI